MVKPLRFSEPPYISKLIYSNTSRLGPVYVYVDSGEVRPPTKERKDKED